MKTMNIVVYKVKIDSLPDVEVVSYDGPIIANKSNDLMCECNVFWEQRWCLHCAILVTAPDVEWMEIRRG